jgi:hypothetical protein
MLYDVEDFNFRSFKGRAKQKLAIGYSISFESNCV